MVFEGGSSVFTINESFLYGETEVRYYNGSESEDMEYGYVVKQGC